MPAYLNSINNLILRTNLPADKDPRQYGKLRILFKMYPKKNVKVIFSQDFSPVDQVSCTTKNNSIMGVLA